MKQVSISAELWSKLRSHILYKKIIIQLETIDRNVVCFADNNECLSQPCKNGATCQDHVNHYQCLCLPDMFGQTCEIGGCCHVVADDYDIK